MITIMIPTALRAFTENKSELKLETDSVEGSLGLLISQHSELKKHIMNEQGKLRSFVNIYVNEQDIRQLQGVATKIKNGDVVSIVPSIAGGVNKYG